MGAFSVKTETHIYYASRGQVPAPIFCAGVTYGDSTIPDLPNKNLSAEIVPGQSALGIAQNMHSGAREAEFSDTLTVGESPLNTSPHPLFKRDLRVIVQLALSLRDTTGDAFVHFG